MSYDVFGVPEVTAGVIQPFSFTGYQADDISNLYYAQARYYDPTIARFTAQDPHWNPADAIRLIGYSHGGNVAIETINILSEHGIDVATIATPVRSDYQISESANVGQHINVYNSYDTVQLAGGSVVGLGGRRFSGAENVRVRSIPWHIRALALSPVTLVYMGIAAHGFMHGNVSIWERYITPHIRVCD